MKNAAGDLPDRSEVTAFDQGKLKHVQTTEKNVLPDKSSMYSHLLLHTISIFLSSTSENLISMMSFAAIQEEKIDSRAEVKEFSKDKLKHVDTVEKNALPTANGNSKFDSKL
jgi:hypothetical protein